MKNIYFNGNIYQYHGLDISKYSFLELKLTLSGYPSIPVSGSHSFKDAQVVTEGVDYEKGPDKDFILVATQIN